MAGNLNSPETSGHRPVVPGHPEALTSVTFDNPASAVPAIQPSQPFLSTPTMRPTSANPDHPVSDLPEIASTAFPPPLVPTDPAIRTDSPQPGQDGNGSPQSDEPGQQSKSADSSPSQQSPEPESPAVQTPAHGTPTPSALPGISPGPLSPPKSDNVPAPVIVVGSSTITRNSASAFVVGSQTLAAGGSAIQHAGTTLSLAPGGSVLVANGRTSAVAVPVAPLITAAPGLVATPVASSGFVVQGSTLYESSSLVISGTTVAVGSSGNLLLDGATLATPVAPLITVAPDAVATPIGTSVFIIQGSTMSKGSSLILDGTTFAASSSGALVVNGATFAAPTTQPSAIVPDVIPTNMPELVVGSTTLAPGQSVVVSGTTFVIPVAGGGIVVNGKLTLLPSGAIGSPVTLDGVVVTPTAASDYIIAGTILQLGSAVIVQGTTYSLASSVEGIIVNGKTVAAPTQEMTIGSEVTTMTPTLISGTAAYIVAGQTLTPGGEVNVNGATLRIAPSGGSILVEGAAETGRPNIAGAIMSVLGVMTKAGESPTASGTPASSGSAAVQTSFAISRGVDVSWMVGFMLIAACLVH